MLIRFIVKNLFSFKEQTEFNVLPGRVRRLSHHKYERNGVEILKLSAIYGANASGKSNMIKSMSDLRSLIMTGKIPTSFITQKFKLAKSSLSEPVELGIEFFANNQIYFYSVAVQDGAITDEYFSSNSSDNKEEDLIFHRVSSKGKNTITFFEEFERDNQTLKKIVENDLLKPNQPLFYLLNSISNDAFIDIKVAHDWFEDNLIIIFPDSYPAGLAHQIDSKPEFKDFSNNLIYSFNTGITNIKVDKKKIEEFLGEDDQDQINEIKANLSQNPEDKMVLMSDKSSNEQVVIVNEDGKIVAKKLLFEHRGEDEKSVEFKFSEESDGTKRLVDYIPALQNIVNSQSTYIIDEIERSIHPLMIKEIIEKFSKDDSTKGQLIFSTHESNLLDQEFIRADEIWFSEKDIFGATKMYSLSDFKEHNTIDIRRGYLNGRYGAIPFLGNLKDLNWSKYNDAGKE